MLFTNKKRHRSVRIALRDINKKGVEIGVMTIMFQTH